MNAIVVGSGRMGIRHINGLLNISKIKKILVVDISVKSLENASKNIIDLKSRCEFKTSIETNEIYEIGIIASTAGERINIIKKLNQIGCKHILIEKPLGQSKSEVKSLIKQVQKSNIKCYVNLNMRLHKCFMNLKNDFEKISQLNGYKVISLNTGSVGIGANGIHYLDFIFFLTDADNATIRYGNISNNIILSGRGSEFCDFGGNAIIDYYKKNNLEATFIISINPNSTAFGNWNIVAKHAHINISELDSLRTNRYRKIDSNLPLNRYNGDYMEPERNNIEFPPLADLTQIWAEGIINGQILLPTIQESVNVHNLMFEWLDFSKTHKDYFPIT